MTIKEVSQRYGITQDTLRYYEKAGIIPPVTRTPGGIRNYTQEDLIWVEQAKCMRNVSFTKEELLKMNAQLNKIKKPQS